MLGWDLGWSALTAASHVAIIVSVFLVLTELSVVSALPDPRRVLDLASVKLAFVAMLAVLVVERLYYISTRLLVRSDVDLWAAHPAPELLAVMLAGAIFALAATLMRANAPEPRQAQRIIWANGAAIVVIWCGVAAVLA